MEDYEKTRADEELLLNALEEAEAALLEDGSQGSYWHLLGYVYTQLEGDQLANVLAEDALTRAFELNSRNVSTRLMLARLLLNRDSYDRALYHLEAVLLDAPEFLQASLAADMCRAYLEDEQVQRGEKFFKRMLGEGGEGSSARLALAILLHEAGRTGEALLQLETLLKSPKALPEDVEHARLLDRTWKEGDRS
jgi:lipopolysaccharide biosynthesis regulator YciM